MQTTKIIYTEPICLKVLFLHSLLRINSWLAACGLNTHRGPWKLITGHFSAFTLNIYVSAQYCFSMQMASPSHLFKQKQIGLYV